jgi:hypothetical protein
MRAISKRRKKISTRSPQLLPWEMEVDEQDAPVPSQRVPRWRMGSQGWAAAILLWWVCMLALIAPVVAADEMNEGNWPTLGAAMGAGAAAVGRRAMAAAAPPRRAADDSPQRPVGDTMEVGDSPKLYKKCENKIACP